MIIFKVYLNSFIEIGMSINTVINNVGIVVPSATPIISKYPNNKILNPILRIARIILCFDMMYQGIKDCG